MNERIVESLIAEGYTGYHVAEMDECRHDFQQVWVFKYNDVEGDLELRVFCVKCHCDPHAGEMMGLDPDNYCEDVSKYV